jgi:hypothetical protein
VFAASVWRAFPTLNILRELPGVKPGRGPGFVERLLATLLPKAPSAEKWVHEIKFDGYRTQVHIQGAASSSSRGEGSRSAATPRPRGRVPSMADLTRAGATKARLIVMRTARSHALALKTSRH